MMKPKKRVLPPVKVFSEVFTVSACPWTGSGALSVVARSNFVFQLTANFAETEKRAITCSNVGLAKFLQHVPIIPSLTVL